MEQNKLHLPLSIKVLIGYGSPFRCDIEGCIGVKPYICIVINRVSNRWKRHLESA